jgi:hypothetical protein
MDIFQALEEGRKIFCRADQLGSTTCDPLSPLAEVWVCFWSIKDLKSAGMAGISNHTWPAPVLQHYKLFRSYFSTREFSPHQIL